MENLISSIFSFIAIISNIQTFRENQDKIPLVWWISHSLICLIVGLTFFKTDNFTLFIVLLMLTFFCILFDAIRFHKPILQALTLLLALILQFQNIGIEKIDNRLSWFVFFGLYIWYFMLPILSGIGFFKALKQNGFNAFDIALVISLNYFLGLMVGNLIN